MTRHSRRDVLARAGAGAMLIAGSAHAHAQALSVRAPPSRDFTADEASAARRILAEAPSHGLILRGGTSDEAESNADLRKRLLSLARAQHGGRIATSDFDKNWGMRPAPYDAERDLDFALAQGRLEAWLESLPPPFVRYRTLRDGLATYRKLADAGGWGVIPAGPDLRVGARDPRVRALRARMAFEDESLRGAPLKAPFDDRLAEAVERVQIRHGIAPTGVAGAATVRALNVSPTRRAQQIVANMERWRWMPRQQPADRIEVNIAAAVFELYADDAVSMRFLAAAGRPKDETPILASTITSIVFNPPWNVPTSIASKEIYPKAHRDSGYFAREGFVTLKTGTGTRLLQRPGPKNALGQVKFDFANAYSVYLHDTPARAAFTRASRSVSHGCVRLEKPVELAERLLGPNGDYPPERVSQTIDAAATARVPLEVPMPVELLYWTAFPQGEQLAFRDDVYGWDDEVLRLLDAGRAA